MQRCSTRYLCICPAVNAGGIVIRRVCWLVRLFVRSLVRIGSPTAMAGVQRVALRAPSGGGAFSTVNAVFPVRADT